MKNLIVELVVSEESFFDQVNKKMILNKSEYLEFIQIAKKANVLDDMVKNISFGCDKCKTFVVKTSVIYSAIEKVMDFMDSDDFISESQSSVYDSLWELKDKLIESALLTDEEWNLYLTKGLKDNQFIYNNKKELVTDDDGNPLRFISDEVVFKFDDRCECKKIIDSFSKE